MLFRRNCRPLLANALVNREMCGTNHQVCDSHVILCNCPCFIRTENSSTAQCFNTVQTVDESLMFHHAADCQCKGNGNGCWQALRNGSNGNGDARHQHIKNWFSPENPCEKDQNTHDNAEQCNDFSQSGKTFLQRCLRNCDIVQQVGNLSHLRFCTRCNDAGSGRASQDGSSCIDDIFLVEGVVRVGFCSSSFGNSSRFAR